MYLSESLPNSSASSTWSDLLAPLIADSLPRGFLVDLLNHTVTQDEPEAFTKVTL